jgi:hypothetical protein
VPAYVYPRQLFRPPVLDFRARDTNGVRTRNGNLSTLSSSVPYPFPLEHQFCRNELTEVPGIFRKEISRVLKMGVPEGEDIDISLLEHVSPIE